MANRATLQIRRLKILDTLLKWEGELSNARVRELIDIQTVQASRLLSEYRDAHQGRLAWDVSTKRYRRVVTREKYGGSADDYLHLLYDEQDVPDWLVRLDTQISTVRPEVLATLRKSIEGRTPVRIIYASMAHPEGTDRVIFPHGIVQAGRRWHVRAWCCLRREFRDFVIGRIREIDAAKTEDKPDALDEAWEAMVRVRFVPHRNLNVAQANVVRDELFEGTMAKSVNTRGCLVPYLIQEVRAAISVEQQPPEYQIEVSNLGDISCYLFTSTYGEVFPSPAQLQERVEFKKD